jgi:hypothetical protein
MTLHPTPNRAEPDDDTVVPDPVVEIEYDANQLRHLLDTIDDILSDQKYNTGAARNHDLDRAAALVRIARDLAERLSGKAALLPVGGA